MSPHPPPPSPSSPSSPQAPAPPPLLAAWLQAREQDKHARAVDIASGLSVSEAELVASAMDAMGVLRSTRLNPPSTEMLLGFPELGEVKAITRNPSVVIEVVGKYGNMEFMGTMGQSVAELDLRIFLSRWKHAFVLDEQTSRGPRQSLQFFDASGRAIHKIYKTDETDAAAFQAWIDRHRATEPLPPIQVEPVAATPAAKPDGDVDAEGFRAAWRGLKDTHEFFGLLARFGVTRTQALRLASPEFTAPAHVSALERVLTMASEAEIDIMVFVGNPGLIQIHSGKVKRIVKMENWLNVLDPRFNLHVKSDEIAAAWVVTKPTVDGNVTSLELYDREGTQIALVVGKRKPGQQEQPSWRVLVEGLKQ